MSPPVAVWHVAREYAGVAEAGGVKDVVRGLAEALARRSVPTTVVLPFYGFLKREIAGRDPVASFTLSLPDQDKGNQLFEEPVQVFPAELEGVRLFLVQSPRYAALRDVYTYTAEDEAENHHRKKGTGHWDSHQLNLILQRAALETSYRLGEAPSIFHCHDGHTAFLPALMREAPPFAARFGSSAAVVTIHNAGRGYHQEVWSPEFAALLTGLPEQVLHEGMLQGSVDPLLLAGSYALLCTVSAQYARELLAEKDSEFSGGLGRAYRERGVPLVGITNGVDPVPWDPRFPEQSGLPCRFDPSNGDLAGKKACRRRLEEELGLPTAGSALYAFVGRLTAQKGVDVLFGSLKDLLSSPSSPVFVVLGQGEREKEEMFSRLARKSRKLSFAPRYDPTLAKLIYAASDFFLVPSVYEPCGLTDFIAQILGSIPIVHRVGGLVKIRDGQTGFSYDEQSSSALSDALLRTADMFASRPDVLEAIRRRAFLEIFSDHTWDRVLEEGYLKLYSRALDGTPWTQR
ncbi:MAG TPA: glycogen/starch synthase [Spirochaetia bacterium]|nr:glycogen/starch synthase [Spirochaetia bacterium]